MYKLTNHNSADDELLIKISEYICKAAKYKQEGKTKEAKEIDEYIDRLLNEAFMNPKEDKNKLEKVKK